MNPHLGTKPLRYVVFAAGVAAIGGFPFGNDAAVVNGAINYLNAHFHLYATQEGLISLLFMFVAIGLVDRIGRKPLLVPGTATQTLALATVGWAFHAHQHGPLLMVCVVGFIAAFAMAVGPTSWLLCSEIFHNRVRGRTMSVAALTVWVSCYVVAQAFPILNDSTSVGPSVTFWLYVLVSLFSPVFAVLLIPETKGRTLEEIESLWPAAQRGGAT